MNTLEITRRRLLQSGGVVMVSSLFVSPLSALASTPATSKVADIPLDRVNSFIAMSADGKVTAFNGHVDLGTGVRTSLAQIVADEIGVRFEDVTMILGDTNRTPNQGPTIASSTLQVSAVPLRQAAAQVREMLTALATKAIKLPAEQLRAEQGFVFVEAHPAKRLSYAQLAEGQDLNLPLDTSVQLKSVKESQYVGKPVARVDIPVRNIDAFYEAFGVKPGDAMYIPPEQRARIW